MKDQIIPVSQLNEKQIAELASLHYRVMHTLLSDLGLPMVEKYYQIACRDSTVIGFCALSETGHLLGWAIGSPKPEQLNRRLREVSFWFISQMLRVLMTRPQVMKQLLSSLESTALPMPADAIELTYLGVDLSARRQGVGRELLHMFTRAAQEAKYHMVVLSVESENRSAIALYTRAGFKIIDTFAEGSFHRHRMELTL
jgi:ribosomal protein S18 acetylase RimI-like enzyme